MAITAHHHPEPHFTITFGRASNLDQSEALLGASHAHYRKATDTQVVNE